MKKYVALLLACSGLAACGGGGGGGGGGVAPVASTPAPAATNATLTNLVASQSFATAGGSLNSFANSNGTSGPTSLVGAGVDGVGVAYNATNQSYTLTANVGSQTFTPSNRDAGLSTGQVTVYTKRSGNVSDQLALANGGAAGFTYSNFAAWTRTTASTTASPVHNSFVVYGIPTASSDLPRSGSATYSIVGGGIWAVNNSAIPLAGKGTLTADFAAATVQTTFDLGLSNIGGIMTGSAPISSGNASFSGSMQNALFAGPMAGGFFGPGAQEVGAAFTLTNKFVPENYVEGYFVGKK